MKKKINIINSIDLYISAPERESIVNACLFYLDSLDEAEKKEVLDAGLGVALKKMLKGLPEGAQFASYGGRK